MKLDRLMAMSAVSALCSLIAVVDVTNAEPGPGAQQQAPAQRAASPELWTGQHRIFGPHQLSASELGALLAAPKPPPAAGTPNRGVPYPFQTQDIASVRVTDPALRAAAEGQPRPSPMSGPNPQMQTPPPTSSWEATAMSNWRTPDPQIAVSTSHVVVATQDILGFFKKDGTPLGTTNYTSFFKPLALDDGTVNGSRIQSDPRLIFDGFRKRFWLIHGAGNGAFGPVQANVRGRIYVAVSQSEDPTAGWNLYWWDGVADWHVPNSTIYQLGDVSDYPSIGIDQTGFHQTIAVCNPYIVMKPCTDSAAARYALLVSVPAKDLADGTSTSGSYFIFADPNGNMMKGVVQPTVHHGSSAGHAYFVGRWGSNQLLVWRLSPPVAPQPAQLTPKPASVTVQPFGAPPDAPQKGPPGASMIAMSNLGTTPLKVVYRDGLLHVVANDARAWFNDGKNLNSIRLVRFSVVEYPSIPTSGQTFIDRIFGMNNVFDDKPEIDHMYYGWPAVEVNKNRDMVVVYARSGTTIFPQVRFSVRYNAESDVRPSRLLHDGEATTKGYRWGDTGGASVDPDDISVWIVHQYARDVPGSYYGIWVGKVTP